MSFNTSYIQSDTLETATSTTIAGHILSNGPDDVLTLSGVSGVMGCTQLNTDVIVSGTLSANTLIPSLGVGYDMALTGNLDMSEYDVKQVKGLSTLSNSYGTSGQVLKTDGAACYWATDAAGDVSQWATYGASANVNLNGKNLTDSTRSAVFIPQNITSLNPTGLGETTIGNSVDDTTKPAKLFLTTNSGKSGDATAMFWQNPNNAVVSGTNFYNKPRALVILSEGDTIIQPNNGVLLKTYNNGSKALYFGPAGSLSFNASISNGGMLNGNVGTTGQIVQSNGVNAPPSWVNAPTASNWATYQAVQDVDINDKNLTNVNNVNCQKSIFQNVAKTEQINLSYGFSQIEPSISALVVSDPNQEYAYISTNGSIEALNTMNTQRFSVLNPSDLTGAILGDFKNLGDNTGSCLITDIINIKRRSNKLLYVSSASSGGVFEDGQVLTPFSTIQKALDYINTNYDGTYYYIQLQNGVYSESFTITKPCFIQGLGKSTYEDGVGCQITGTITVNIPTTGNMFNTCFNLSGVLLSGYINNISNGDTCLNLRDVYIYSSGSSIVHNPSGLSRLRIQDCYFNSVDTSSTDPLLDIRSESSLLMSNTIINAKGLQSCLKFSASATCDTVVNCKFECGNTSASVQPLVYVAGTTSATFTFTNCGFLYSSTTSKSANALACGIYNNTSTGNNRIVSLYNSFFLLGTDVNLNYAIEDAKYGTANAMAVLYYMCGASLANAFSIHAIQNVNKFQLNIVS